MDGDALKVKDHPKALLLNAEGGHLREVLRLDADGGGREIGRETLRDVETRPTLRWPCPHNVASLAKSCDGLGRTSSDCRTFPTSMSGHHPPAIATLPIDDADRWMYSATTMPASPIAGRNA